MQTETQPYSVIVAGSRHLGITTTDVGLALMYFNILYGQTPRWIVSGHATGPDRVGEVYARENGLRLLVVPANWARYGKQAGFVRNKEMAGVADGLIAFWDLRSNGTRNMIELMLRLKKQVFIEPRL